ncbi:MAG TPA: IS3 family transposase [Candidatus Avacidaminococcus intestinavium]|uniref:IS3 family transposase n=1 Tax=Candidatus Avacidaminococcus intestinavium TaxID=2840684 RepID=A0A9D1SLA4_9FIRM|nr:IS3 family transposase [Candidatus Avacidaminococcus intestinavium]
MQIKEVFFKFIKHEELKRHHYHSLSELKLAIFEYIEGFYNSHPPHSANDYLSPNQKEALYFQNLSS